MENLQLKSLFHELAIPLPINHVSIDTREDFSPNTLFFALPGINCHGERFVLEAASKGAVGACVPLSFQTPPALPKDFFLFRVQKPLHTLQKLASTYLASLDVEVTVILGTHGKTLAKDLIGHIFQNNKEIFFSKGSLNSQLGVPLSVFSLEKHHRKAVFEVAFSERGELPRLWNLLKPQSAIITQVQPKEIGLLSNPQKFWEEILTLDIPEWLLVPEETGHVFNAKRLFFFKDKESPLPQIIKEKETYRFHSASGQSAVRKFHSSFPYLHDHLLVAIQGASLLGADEKEITEAFLHYHPDLKKKEIWKTQSGIQVISDAAFAGIPSLRDSLKLLSLFPQVKKKIGYIQGRKKKLPPDIKAQFDAIFFEEDKKFEHLKEELNSGDLLFFSGDRHHSLDSLSTLLDEAPYGSFVTINLANLKENIDYYRRHLPAGTHFMAVLKAFGYGTDPLSSLLFLRLLGIDYFALAHVEEGVFLRKAGVKDSLFVLHASYQEVEKALRWNLEIGVSSLQEIENLERHAQILGKKGTVHLHIDTGMNRFGCDPDDAVTLGERIASSPHLVLKGALTHFAAAEDASFDDFTQRQIKTFESCLESLKKRGITVAYRHAANSSAALRFPIPCCNLVRVGLGLWGLTASNEVKKHHRLKPAPSLYARITHLQHCKRGETVSYGCSYVVEREKETIAILPIGYFDGLKRRFSASSSVLIRGKKAPMVGKICMDFMMVNVTDIPEAEIGDLALIFGEDSFGNRMPLEELARTGSSHAHELFSSLGPRLPRIFLYDEAP